MKIELKIKRQGGSHVTIGTKKYHFAPDEHGRHVADVEDEDHIDCLLKIPEYRGLEEEEPAEVPVPDTASALDPDNDPQDDKSESPSVYNELDTYTEPESDKDEDELEKRAALDIEQARQAYLETFGKRPHPNMKAENIYYKISEAKQDEGK